MLYLIRTFGRTKTGLKVGYAKNEKERMKTYYHHNPFFETVTFREGELYDEMLLHLYLKSRNLKLEILNEWFLDCDEVVQRFHDRLEKIKKEVWKNRDSLFQISDFKSGGNILRRKIYEDLRLVYYESGKEKEIDNLWRQEANKKVLKKMREEAYGTRNF